VFHYGATWASNTPLARHIFKPWPTESNAYLHVEMANIKDVFDLTSGSGLIPAAPRERLVKRATTGDWSTFDEDALLLVDNRCLPENPHADVEQARANGEWNEDGDDDDDDEEEEEEPEAIEEEEQKDEAVLLPSPSLRKKRKRQPKVSVRSSRRRKQN